MTRRHRRSSREALPGLALAALMAAAGTSEARAQEVPPERVVRPAASATDGFATRARLQARLDSLRNHPGWGRPDSVVRRQQQEIRVLERRLREGDFRPGDVIRLQVRGDTSLTGHHPVRPGPLLELPLLDDIDLRGVLFAEADSVVRGELSKYLRRPEIEVQVLRRVAVTGAVGQAGYYDFPPSATLAEVVMSAGGMAGNARLEKLEFRRDGENLLEDYPTSAIPELTLVDLDARRGDQLYLPAERGGSAALTALSVVGSLAGLALLFTRF